MEDTSLLPGAARSSGIELRMDMEEAVAGLPNSSFEDQILRMPGLPVTC